MRFHFPNGEHEDYQLADGRLLIGSGAQAELCIKNGSVAAEHVQVSLSQVRGIELDVRPGAELYVNGRLIKEKALARLGDVLLLGSVQVLLRSDSDRHESPPAPAEELYKKFPPRASLRAVSGQHFGKMISLKPRTVIGRGPECDIVINDQTMSRQHAVLENTASGLYLRDLDSANGSFLNGAQVRNAVLQAGDQIAFDSHRFIVEIIGFAPLDALAYSRPSPTQVVKPVRPIRSSTDAITPQQPQQISAPIPPPPIPLSHQDNESRATQWANALLVIAAIAALTVLYYFFGGHSSR